MRFECREWLKKDVANVIGIFESTIILTESTRKVPRTLDTSMLYALSWFVESVSKSHPLLVNDDVVHNRLNCV